MTTTTRRTILRSTGAAAVAVALPLRAQAPVTLKLHTFWPEQAGVWREIIVPWIAQVEQESNGRIRIEASPSMKLGGPPGQLYDQVREGKVDLTMNLTGYTPGRFPRVEAFELPFMMTQPEGTSKALWEYVQTAAPAEFKDVQLLATHVHGPGVIHTADRAVLKVEDMRDRKLRSPTRQVNRLLTFLGSTSLSMPVTEIPDAMGKGLITGCVVPWEILPSFKGQQLTKYHAEFANAGGSLYTSTIMFVMNKARYSGLPADLRKVIDNNSGVATSGRFGKTMQALDVVGREAAVKNGNSIVTLNVAEARKFRSMSRLVEVEWAEAMDQAGASGYRLLDTARNLIDHHTRSST